MKFISFLVIAVALISVVRSDFIIDAFNNNGTIERVGVIPAQVYGTAQYAPFVQNQYNNVTNVTVKIFPNLYTAQNFVGLTGVLGGTRRIVIASTTSTLTYTPTYGISSFITRNQYNVAYGADIAAITYVNYIGNYSPDLSNCSFPYPNQCIQQTNVGPLLPNAYDITENGQDQALAFTVVYADQVGTQFTFLVYSNTTAISQRFIRTTAQKRDSSAEDYDEDFYSWEVKLDQPVILANGKRATTGRRYVLPFSSFTRLPTALTAADFTQVRGVQFQIANIIAIDNIVSDFRTVPLISGVKGAVIAETVVVDSVAEPFEVINYTISINVVSGLDVPVTNVFFYDNPTKFISYANFLPNTVSLLSYSYSQINCSANDSSTCIDQYNLDPTNFGASILNSSVDPAFANRIAIFFPAITTGSIILVNFSMSVPQLPCQMQTCSQGCTATNQNSITGGCYCQINQGRVCYNLARNRTGTVAAQLDATNDTSASVAGCSATSDVFNTSSYLTVTPVGTRPNPALTIAANPTEKANGVFPCNSVDYTVTLVNNQSRSSDAFIVRLTPDVNTVCATGAGTANPNFTQDATTNNPIYSVPNGLQYGATLTFTISCNASCQTPCGVNQTSMAAVIDFGTNTVNCPQTTTADDAGIDTIPLIGAASISLTKANATALTFGSNSSNVASFLISYANIGQRTASGVVITETVPAALAQYYVASDNPSFTSTGGNTYQSTFDLTAGQSGSVNFLLRGPSTINDCTTGSFINTVSSNSVCGGAAITATAYVGINAVPDMAIVISNVSSSVQPGASVCYNVQYQNIGYRVAQSVVLSINLPTFTTFVASGSAAWVQSGTSSVYTLTVGDIAALSTSASAQFCVAAASNTGCTAAFFTTANVTSVCALFPETNLVNNFATSTTTSISGTVSLTVTKTAAASANAGSTVVYTIAGSNTGTSQAQNLTIVETLPSGVTAGSNSGFVAGAAGTYSFFVGTVNAGASFGPYNFSVVLPSSVACPAPTISNTVTVSETCTGATATATAVVSIIASPTLTLTANNVTTIDLTSTTQSCVYACYGNTGTQTANNATMTLNYGTSAYLTPVSGANNGWTQSATGVLSFNVGNINVGSNTCSPSACFTVSTPVPCGLNNFNFTFALTSPCAPTQNVVAATTTNIIANPSFYIAKTNNIAGTASPGASVTYTITYGNNGLRNADNVILTETVPELLLNYLNNNGWSCSGSSCTYNVGSLSSSQGQQTVTFSGSLSTNVPGQTVVNNTVTISSPQPCASTASSSSQLSVAGYPNLIISKDDGGVTITPGDMIMYTITYSNIGDTSAVQSVVTDIVPAFTIFNATLSTAGWSCQDGAGAGSVCTINVGTVAPGQSGTVSFVVKSDDWIRCGTDYTQNFVYINTTTQESNYNDNNATDITPITGEPDLVIMKMANRTASRADRAGPGELITYTISYSNVGVRDATNAVIYETVPAFTTFVAAASSAEWSCQDGAVAGTECTIRFNDTSLYPVMPGMMSMNAMGEYTFTVRVLSDLPPEAHITTNCVSINNTCGECNPFDNMACFTVNLFGVPDLTLNQSAVCRSIHWYLEWQNTGDQGASNVVLTDSVPAGTVFNAAASDSRWSCNTNVQSAQYGQCTLNVGEVASGAGGSAVFVTSPQNGTTSDVFSNTGCAQGTGRNPDPTPENNCDTADVGFSGCPDTCDSCCPTSNECCPDKTNVQFEFAGLLRGIDSCSSGSSSS